MTDYTLYLIKAFFLGIIEGLTEFIPVSSTGHLILIGDWIHFQSSSAKVFEVVIQFGSILAVMWIFRARLWQLIQGTFTGVRSEMMFTRNLLLAFLPAAVIGAIFIHAIKNLFYHPRRRGGDPGAGRPDHAVRGTPYASHAGRGGRRGRG